MNSAKNQPRLSIAKGGPIRGDLRRKGNLARILIDAANSEAGDQGITFIQNDDSEVFYSYKTILARAERSLGALQEYGLKPGDHALLILSDNAEFIITFWACILGGIVPVPLAYPVLTNARHASVTRLLSVWDILERPAIVSNDTIWNMREVIRATLNVNNISILSSSSLYQNNHTGRITLTSADTTAFIQFSSGSTSDPKGILLSHNNLLTNIESIASHTAISQKDIFLSWMPYYHDMGLICFNLIPTAYNLKQFNMSPLKFVKNPQSWFNLISKHGVTVSSSPNFGYRHLLRAVAGERLDEWDLSSLRLLFNGGEPISARLIQRFMEKCSTYGLSEAAMHPGYGLAEATVGVSSPKPGTVPLVHTLDRMKLANEDRAVRVPEGSEGGLQVVDEGYPLPEVEVRIVDRDGQLVPEGVVGEIQIRGTSVTSGYINNPTGTATAFQGNWLKTGDTGFMLEGRLAVTGRIKDIIFSNGSNFFAHDIEAVIEQCDGVQAGKFAVCGWTEGESNTEKVGLFIRVSKSHKHLRSFYSTILSQVNEVMGIPLDYIVQVPSIPKTTSGKVQRFMLVNAFMRGDYEGNVIAATTLWTQPTEALQDAGKGKLPNPQGMFAERIRNIWARVLDRRAETIPFDRAFFSLGGTSLKAVQALGSLEAEFGILLTNDVLVKCHTINQLDTYIHALIGEDNKVGERRDTRPGRHVSTKASTGTDIAVVEMACRFPDADSPEEFWVNLVNGRCSIGEAPPDRWNVNTYAAFGAEFGTDYCRAGAFIAEPYAFDPGFFRISASEATVMDPQQRLILQLFFDLLERAGYTKHDVDSKRVGVFIGASNNSYYEFHSRTLAKLALQNFTSFAALTKSQQDDILEEWQATFGSIGHHSNIAVGNILNMIAARIAHEFNLRGPNMVVDTACSSSLVAIHLASESLRRGECDIAVAGGINLILTPNPYIFLSSAGVLSHSGRSLVFDAEADGFVPGEGAGLVILKNLDRAMADGDRILAIIKGSAVNNDGRSLGVMSPNPDGQREVIESVYAKTGIDPGTVQYVEAHGTGTPIGDPSEVRALDNAFSRWAPKTQSIAIGSVKTNIGHLVAAAGVAGFIKTVLALVHGKLPPMINLRQTNPLIKFERTPFYPLTTLQDWPVQPGVPRRAAIDSFGFGGTNCHMLLEGPAAINAEKDKLTLPRHVLCFSAHSPEAFTRKAHTLANYLDTHVELPLGDVCFTENTTRTSLPYRSYAVASSVPELAAKIREATPIGPVTSPRIGFMFTGQGSQYVGMGKALCEYLPSFRNIMDQCSEAFFPYLNARITDLLFGNTANEQALAQTSITQAVVFAFDYALGKYLTQIGVKPSMMVGHSVGEWVAACLAGTIDLPSAARLVAARGRLMGALPSSGGMAAVFAPATTVEQFLAPFDGSLSIAAHNISHLVVSGETKALNQFLGFLRGKGIMSKILRVSHAFHTQLMKPMLEEFRLEMAGVNFASPQIPLVSCVTGSIIDTPIVADHWLQHILNPVRFEQAIDFMRTQGINIFLEVGPDKVLSGMLNSVDYRDEIRIYSSCNRYGDALEILLDTLGSLFISGATINWRVFKKDFSYTKLLLPAYPFTKAVYKPDFGVGTAERQTLEPELFQAEPITPTPKPHQISQEIHQHNLTDFSAGVVNQQRPFEAADVRNLTYMTFATLIGIPLKELDVTTNFLEIGIDSLKAVKAMNELSKRLNAELNATLILEYQTPEALASYLEVACAGNTST